jgi:ribose-phosphate pyrophosphokinase
MNIIRQREIDIMIKLNGEEVKFTKFPNGETLLNHKELVTLVGKYSHDISFKYEDDSDLIKLMLLKNYLDECRFERVCLTIYYMPYSRMDRSENNSPFTLKYISRFINSLEFYNVEVIEPHSDVTCALIDRAEANFINFYLLPTVMEMETFDKEKDYVVFPDFGASRRYKNMNLPNVLIGDKKRDFGTGVISKLDLIGDTDNGKKTYGRSAIIVDDLSSYGGTFINMADRLREEGFVNVYLLVAHAENKIFERNERTGKLLFEHVEKIYTTDTILTDYENIEYYTFNNQLTVFNIEDVLDVQNNF